MGNEISIAYFSMEIGIESAMHTYAGGLGVLAGDTLRSAADAGIAMLGLTLLSRKGYFHQKLDENGWQTEESVNWPVSNYLIPLDLQVTVFIEDREVAVRCWRYDITGHRGHIVPVYFLDTDIDINTEFDRSLTDHLYGNDKYYRLCQEAILGIGGIRLLRELGHMNIERYHMNEGHSSLLVFELLNETILKLNDTCVKPGHIDMVRRQCVFTTHTPVMAGRENFSIELANQVLHNCKSFTDCSELFLYENQLNLTHLALSISYYINGVAKKHGETSRKMFAGYSVDSITNGVHAYTWASPAMRKLFDKKIRDWRDDNASLRYAISFQHDEIWDAHQQAKRELIEYVNKTCNTGMDQNTMTLGFARRATLYKRTGFIFSDIERLNNIAKHCGPLQIIFAGKAHPQDNQGKQLIHDIFSAQKSLSNDIRIVYIPDYDIKIGQLLTAGSDLWLNTPKPTMEASGTSGMKAAINGVPSLSVLDGWWLEGCIDGVTGWAIGNPDQFANQAEEEEYQTLYSLLENTIIPMFYHDRNAYLNIMRYAIAINGSFFNTERMISQYVTKAYFR